MNGPSPLDGQFRARCAALARRLASRLRKGAADGGRSPSEGRVEFREHRLYVPGDDLRDLDWNAYARLDTWVTKSRTRDEAPELLLIIDRSGSMGPPGSDQDRMTLQWGCAAGFVALAASGRVTLAIPDRSGVLKTVFRGQGTSNIPAWVRAIEALPLPQGSQGALGLSEWPSSGPGVALLLLTDALGAGAPAGIATRVASAPCGGTIGLVMAHARPQHSGRGRIIGLEGEPELECDDLSAIEKIVAEERKRHVESIQSSCRRHGSRCVVGTAGDVVEKLVTSWVLGGNS